MILLLSYCSFVLILHRWDRITFAICDVGFVTYVHFTLTKYHWLVEALFHQPLARSVLILIAVEIGMALARVQLVQIPAIIFLGFLVHKARRTWKQIRYMHNPTVTTYYLAIWVTCLINLVRARYSLPLLCIG